MQIVLALACAAALLPAGFAQTKKPPPQQDDVPSMSGVGSPGAAGEIAARPATTSGTPLAEILSAPQKHLGEVTITGAWISFYSYGDKRGQLVLSMFDTNEFQGVYGVRMKNVTILTANKTVADAVVKNRAMQRKNLVRVRGTLVETNLLKGQYVVRVYGIDWLDDDGGVIDSVYHYE